MNEVKSIMLSKDDFIINFDNSSLKLKFSEDKQRYMIDISDYSIFEATKIAILSSTYCFLHGFQKKLCWLTDDIETYKAINIFKLSNLEGKIIKKEEREVVSL